MESQSAMLNFSPEFGRLANCWTAFGSIAK